MRPCCLVTGVAMQLALMAVASSAAAQVDQPSIDLLVSSGRPLRVALDERIRLMHVGQPVTGSVTEPVYAYDRIVIAVGARVRGQVIAIDGGSPLVRARPYLSGNFSPPQRATLRFDTLLLGDGVEIPIDTIVTGGIPHVTRQMAGRSASSPHADQPEASDDDTTSPSLPARARSEVRQRVTDAIAGAKQKATATVASIKSIREPGQFTRLKEAAIQQLPYHPQYLTKGTVYDAELSTPISFGRVVPAELAPAGTAPTANSILTARLVTTLDSLKTPRGTPFEAVITQTVFSADHRVILPEGTRLAGEVTLARPARRFHRNGQLRFLFERVHVPNQPERPLIGALHSVDASTDDHVAVDDEGERRSRTPRRGSSRRRCRC